MDDAPYFADVAIGPRPSRCVWTRTSDDVTLRAATWESGPRGTVMLFQGRTEYIEKYSDAAAQLGRHGFACAAIDWRGQGLSPRPARDRRLGHVGGFDEYQRDVDALLEIARAADLPRPWHVLGHSMGGAIALRACMRQSVFRRAVFSAPMWGLTLRPHERVMGWGVSGLASMLGLGERNTPGSGKSADPAGQPFEDNLLTTDPEMFAWMKRQIAEHPDLALGGPSLSWLWAALREMHAMARMAAPDLPALTLLGTDERIVDSDAIHVRMNGWDGGTLEIVEGARHEVLMEGEARRSALYDRIAAHLDG
ncbi:alpha/beta fold hydrolase [Jannaschia sp. KMU-145]|uniref:alpha/beta fold hydrolase n=1 Tax=Jannaschia halovivens TaxID=3388667 RepID=UPI00396B0E29